MKGYERFRIIEDFIVGSNNDYGIKLKLINDKVTDVLYFCDKNGGITLLVDRDGKPLTYDEYRDGGNRYEVWL